MFSNRVVIVYVSIGCLNVKGVRERKVVGGNFIFVICIKREVNIFLLNEENIYFF